MTDDPIVITGCGLVTSLGLDVESTWRAVAAGEGGIRPHRHLEQTPDPDRGGGEAPEMDFEGRSREAAYLRRAICQALTAAGQSLEPAEDQAVRRALVMGTTLHGMRAAGRFFRSDSVDDLKNFLAPAVLDAAAGDLGFAGAMFTTCAACASGLTGVAAGSALLRSDQADLVVCGGYDTVSEYAYAGFSSLRLVAAGPARPFCANREGLKLGEGYGALVLERRRDALGRGAKILAVVLGCGETSDAHHLTQPHPEGAGAARAIEGALRQAGVGPGEIGLIAAHATATPDNDRGECLALQTVFGDALPRVPMVSFKSHLGHTLGGAGAVELILALRAMRDGLVPPTRNVNRADLEFPGLRVGVDQAEFRPVNRTLNVSLGFGGSNAVVVLGREGLVSPGQAGRRPEEVWITGIGVLLPGLIGAEAFAAHLERGGAFPSGEVAGEAIESLLQARRVRRMSQYVRLSVAATHLAAQQAGLEPGSAAAADCAAVLASMHGSARYSGDYYAQVVREGLGAANPMLFAEGVPNAAAAHLSMMMGLKQGCQSLIGARTGGLDALGLAAGRIELGEWRRAVVSCAEENAPLVRRAYAHCGLLSPDGRQAAPLGDGAGGFEMSDGAVTVVLESRSAALERGARCLGIVRGWSARSAPGGDPKRQVIRGAGLLKDLGEFDGLLISANGTWIDRIEAAVLQRWGGSVPVGAVAGHVPELFSAAPLAAVAAVLLRGRLPRLLGGPLPGAAWTVSDGSQRSRFPAVFCLDYQGLMSGVKLEIPTS